MRFTVYFHSRYKHFQLVRFSSALTSVTKDVLCVQPHNKRRLDAWIRAHGSAQRLQCSPRVERITVQYVGKFGPQSTISLQMTKGISSPIDCARHLSELLVNQSAIALVNGTPWDMYRPLVEDCELDFVSFKDAYNDPEPANKAFWLSGAFLLGATLESSFRPEHEVRLLSIPSVTPESGGFVCDISFTPHPSAKTNTWIPTEQELRALSAEGQRLASANWPFEPLDASPGLLDSCYADEPLRRAEVIHQTAVPAASANPDQQTVCIYRMGSFVESPPSSPLIASTGLIGRFAVTRFSPLGWLSTHTGPARTGQHVSRIVYRVQGVAIPTAFLTHFTTFERLIRWAREPNPSAPSKPAYVVDF